MIQYLFFSLGVISGLHGSCEHAAEFPHGQAFLAGLHEGRRERVEHVACRDGGVGCGREEGGGMGKEGWREMVKRGREGVKIAGRNK
jgi:hypothetical protein